MSHSFSKILTSAIITGLLSGSVAMAQETEKHEDMPTAKVSKDKESCKGMQHDNKNKCKSVNHKDKESCKAMKKDKNSCSGSNGCSAKMKEKTPAK